MKQEIASATFLYIGINAIEIHLYDVLKLRHLILIKKVTNTDKNSPL